MALQAFGRETRPTRAPSPPPCPRSSLPHLSVLSLPRQLLYNGHLQPNPTLQFHPPITRSPTPSARVVALGPNTTALQDRDRFVTSLLHAIDRRRPTQRLSNTAWHVSPGASPIPVLTENALARRPRLLTPMNRPLPRAGLTPPVLPSSKGASAPSVHTVLVQAPGGVSSRLQKSAHSLR